MGEICDACMGQKNNKHSLSENPRVKSYVRLRHKCRYIEIDLRKLRCEGVDLIRLA